MGGWLLFFSSLPSKPVGNRVKIWRKLTKSGAVQLKGSVYALPAGDEQREFFRRLAAEVAGMRGQAAFVQADRVETVPDAEIIALFTSRTAGHYRAIGGALEALTRRIENVRQSGGGAAGKPLLGHLDRVRRDFAEARRTDYFGTAAGSELEHRIASATDALASLLGRHSAAPPAIDPRSPGAYQGKRWVTRERPFVDRMASAWLIRRFVDPAATFGFVAGDAAQAAGPDAVVFDMAGGEFTRAGDLCTFEVLVRSFALHDPALARMAEIVHDLDAGEERPRRAESAGVAGILEGVRRTARDDADALERGMAVFAALYAATSG